MIYFIIIVFIIFLVIKNSNNRIYQINCKIPGPGFSLPILGNLYSMNNEPHLKMHEWYNRYGNIFRIKMANIETVVLTEKPLLKKAFIDNSNLFKKRYLYLNRNAGIILSNGEVHNKIKTAVLSTITNSKIKSIEEHHFNKEFLKLIEVLDEFANQGKPVQLIGIFKQFALNITCSLVFGSSFPIKVENDGEATKLVNAINNFLNISKLNLFLQYFPKIGNLLKCDPHNVLIEMVSDLVDKYIENEKKDDLTNITILDQFLKLNEKNEINKRNLLFSCADLLFTGVDSTANTALFCLLELINNRNYQTKLYDQVKNNDGELILFNSKYNNNFKFLKLVLLETYRLHPALPLSAHYLNQDVEISDTKIAKGTQIILNIYSSHRSDKFFKSPNDFIPERFEKENDEMDLVAYGIGVRDCIGKSIAKSELFTILATLINRYEFINPNPLVPLNNRGTFSIGVSCPDNFILIKKRDNKK
ncbi:hypothetical protein ACTFIW_006714 [Dictyostelium discoideum]